MMSTILILVTLLSVTYADNATCKDFKTDFDIKKVIGSWHVVAVIPNTNLSRKFETTSKCYQVDFSEVDEGGLKWMIEQRFGKAAEGIVGNITGGIIRLRYHTEEPFDIWSRAVQGESGCYRQLLDLSSQEKNIQHSKSLDSPTLLHLVETQYGDLLLQVLWSRISAIIYRREPGLQHVELLRPVYDYLSLYRKQIEKPKICNLTLNVNSTTRPKISNYN